MAYLIFTTDKPDSETVRAKNRAAHYEFLEAHAGMLIASGGLQDDEATCFIGAAIILDCETREEADAFVAADPFSTADLFETVHIMRWEKAFFDGRRVSV